jgi:hypothetical protein
MNRKNHLLAILGLAAFGLIFWMFVESQDANAIARMDQAACWTSGCVIKIAERVAGRY